MAFSVKVGSFAANTGTGTQSITGVGFQPKAVLFFLAGGLTSDGSAPNFDFCIGFGVSSSQRFVSSWFSEDGLASSDTVRGDHNSRAIGRINNAGLVNGYADVVSMDSDGFTLNWSSAPAAAWIVQYLALGGDDLANAAALWITSKTSTGSQAYTGVGFQPDCVIFTGSSTVGGGGLSSSNELLGTFGFATASGQAATGWASADAQATSRTMRALVATDCIAAVFNDAHFETADLVSMDADGFTLNWNPANGSARTYFALCLKGGQYKIGVETQKTSTGTKATTGVGFQPTGLLLAGVCNTTSTSVVAHSRVTIGIADGTSEGNVWAGDTDAAADTITDHALSRTKVLRHLTEGTPTLDAEADLASFDADGFTLDWTTADATAREFAYLAFGSEGGGGGLSIPIAMRHYLRMMGAG